MGLFGKRHSEWPTAVVNVDEIYVDPENTGKVMGSGSFTVNGEFYSVVFERRFTWSREAAATCAFVESTQTATVRYNPADPSENVIDDTAAGGQ